MNEPVNVQGPPIEDPCASDESVNAATSVDEPASRVEVAPPTTPEVPVKRRAKTRGDWMSGIQWLCSTLVLAIFVITFLAQAFQIPSGSMEKTLLIGDYVLVDKVHYGGGGIWDWVMPYSDIHRGDIIVFRYPVHPSEHFVKRVIGLPGDRIHLFHKRVFVNDRPLDDTSFAIHRSHDFDSYRDNFPSGNYISPDVNSTWWLQLQKIVHQGEITVPPGQYFVLGDNRDDSADSRYWGFVPRENVIGRPLLIYWSVQRPETTAADDKLERLLYTLIHLPEDARWDRTFHLVR